MRQELCYFCNLMIANGCRVIMIFARAIRAMRRQIRLDDQSARCVFFQLAM